MSGDPDTDLTDEEWVASGHVLTRYGWIKHESSVQFHDAGGNCLTISDVGDQSILLTEEDLVRLLPVIKDMLSKAVVARNRARCAERGYHQFYGGGAFGRCLTCGIPPHQAEVTP